VVSLLAVDGLTKAYVRRGFTVHAVTGAELELYSGEVVTLVGQSGSGKSTLLSLLVGWDRPDGGTIRFGGPLADGPSDPADRRWADVAVVPQSLGLLEDLTVVENVLLPARAIKRLPDYRTRAVALMQRLGVAHLAGRFPRQTSLGEQQRVCLARALLLAPQLVFADEPTAHQDHRSTTVMLEVIREEAARGAAFLVATHDPTITVGADRTLRMSDGVLRVEQ
jgi:putative ABC transport system ATP-binding protein